MAMFAAFHVAGSGLLATRKWLDAVSDNIANINTVRRSDETAFQARYVVAKATQLEPGVGGVTVGGIELGSAEGRLVYQPDHPFADADGNVRLPDIDLGSQMAQLMMAQRGYQANLSVVDRARDAYSAAIQIGRNQ